MRKMFLTKPYRGFSLVEMLVAMFIFTLVIGATSQIFTRAFVGYREQKRLQSDIESAQFALNTMAKELRTASVSNSTLNGNNTSIRFFDYSQKLCFRYTISADAGTLSVRSKPGTTLGNCNGGGYSTSTSIVSHITRGRFYVRRSSNSPRVGKVTISLFVDSGQAAPTHLQTTVSLRDYQISGVQN
ncbi:MAG: prepilin-type N-terminal cleavage/methylation domain-containing protein [Candidatus Moranbacteria bacterium]|nr:prepilin-type N-terminal cleavage/methylation domain-containing protein [Candidatus Moranbacteria bacterium]MDD3965390.1 prepilin-type N-terminal cleavage/methylation domain-containing protein [Candidatus Moranbacteria bacterium]